MPDVWTRYPDIVRDLLKEGGFKCGVAPRVLKGRDPAWTCVIDGKTISGDLYIHHVDKLRSELRAPEPPSPMLVPLVVLAALSLLGGLLGLPFSERWNLIGRFLDPVFARYPLPTDLVAHAVHNPGWEGIMLLVSLALAGSGIWLAWHMYLVNPARAVQLSARYPGAYRVLLHKFYVDELYGRIIVEPIQAGARWLWARVDVLIVDGAVNWAGAFVRWDSTWISRVQSGFVRNYALSIFLGVVLVVGYLLVR